jgi:hypothetical protein
MLITLTTTFYGTGTIFLKQLLCMYSSNGNKMLINPLNTELNPIRHLLALAGAHHFVDVSRLRVNVVKFTETTNSSFYCVFCNQ